MNEMNPGACAGAEQGCVNQAMRANLSTCGAIDFVHYALQVSSRMAQSAMEGEQACAAGFDPAREVGEVFQGNFVAQNVQRFFQKFYLKIDRYKFMEEILSVKMSVNSGTDTNIWQALGIQRDL
jgi:hypothetical protein